MNLLLNNLDHQTFNKLTENVEFERIRISYDGQIRAEQVEWFIEVLKNFFELLDVPRQHHGRLIRISIEVIQNIVKHHVMPFSKDSFIILSSSKTHLQLTSCNVVNKNDQRKIIKQFNNLSELKLGELKKAFRTSLSNSRLDEKGGAGIGLVDIVYRSGSVPDYSFSPIPNSDLSYFMMNTKLLELKNK